jgi:hypothetical protein
MDFDSELHRRIQGERFVPPVPDARGEDFRPSELADPAAMLWYMLYPVDDEGLSPAQREEVKIDKETLWLVVDGKHDMDDSEKRKLNVMRFVLESLVGTFVPDGMYDDEERDAVYESFKEKFRAAMPRKRRRTRAAVRSGAFEDQCEVRSGATEQEPGGRYQGGAAREVHAEVPDRPAETNRSEIVAVRRVLGGEHALPASLVLRLGRGL